MVGAQIIFDLVRNGRKVRALKRAGSELSVIKRVFHHAPELLEKIEWIEGDITDLYSVAEALEGVKEVYHSAAIISFRPSEFTQMMKINAEGTANMVNISLEKEVEKFCHISSVAALGRLDQGISINESAVWKTSKSNSNYAISKYAAEREVWRGYEEGLKVVIVNPSIILGPGNLNSGSSKLFKQVWRGLKFYTEGITGVVDVRDVSACCISLMEKEIYGERFILNAENVSYKELLSNIAIGFNKKAPGILAKAWMSEIVWRLEAIRSLITNSNPLITRETSRNSRKKWNYSNEKIKKILGVEFISMKKSVEDTCKVYLEESFKAK